MSFLKDFKDFAMRGNVLDLAVGVIIGGAFGKVVSSLVSDILMPPLGMLLGGVDFSNKFINLTGTPAGVGPVVTGDRLSGGIEGLAPVELSIGPAE